MYEGTIWIRMYNVNVGGKDVTIASFPFIVFVDLNGGTR